MNKDEIIPLTIGEQKRIVDVLLPFVKEFPDLPAPIEFGLLHKEEPSMCIQFLNHSRKENISVTGSFIGEFNFAIWYRLDGSSIEQTQSGLNTLYWIKELFDLATKNHQLPAMGQDEECIEIEMVTSPSIERKVNGMLDYMSIFKFVINHK